jgi:hypothetical protein
MRGPLASPPPPSDCRSCGKGSILFALVCTFVWKRIYPTGLTTRYESSCHGYPLTPRIFYALGFPPLTNQ